METNEVNIEKKCLNCGHSLADNNMFCGHCGQSTKGVTMKLKDILINFWDSLFDLNNRFFRTLKYIWTPWKLTRFYTEGKRRSFLHPGRFFIIALLLHFGLLTSLLNITNQNIGSTQEYIKLERKKLLDKHDQFLSTYKDNEAICSYADSLNQILFPSVRNPKYDQFRFVGGGDSVKILGIKIYPVTRQDAIELSSDSLFAKYGITSFWDKLIMKQYIRMNLDAAGFLKYMAKNMAWGVIPLIISLALLMKLLYIRRKKYFAEHLILLLNIHSLAFLTVSLVLLLNLIWKESEKLYPWLVPLVLIVFFVSTYKYYGQSFFKTLIKNMIIAAMYMIFILVFFIFTALISLLIF